MKRCPHYVEFGYCGLCYSGRRGRASYKGHSCYRPQNPFLRRAVDVPLPRPAPVGVCPVSEPGDEGPLSNAVIPVLRSYLCDTTWADGSPRKPSTLLIFTEDGRWKCCVSDRDQERNAFFTANSLSGLLEAVETALSQDRAEWRKKYGSAPKGKGR